MNTGLLGGLHKRSARTGGTTANLPLGGFPRKQSYDFAVLMNGINQYGTIPISGLTIVDDFSIVFDYQLTSKSISGTQAVFSTSNAGATTAFYTGFALNGANIVIRSGTLSSGSSLMDQAIQRDTKRHQLILSVKRNVIAQYYLDGVAYTNVNGVDFATKIPTSFQTLNYFARTLNTNVVTPFVCGYLSFINTSFTADDASKMWNKGRKSSYQNLFAKTFEYNFSKNYLDSSGNQYTLTDVNKPTFTRLVKK